MDAALVWLERDLRLRDHAPLHAAQSARAAAAVYVVEPGIHWSQMQIQI